MWNLGVLPPLTFTLLGCLPGAAVGADTVYTNGTIYTVDAARPWAQELRVSGGRISCVGQVGACRESTADLIDLDGRFVMPGVIDSHTHLRYAPGTRFLSLHETGTVAEFREAIRAHAASHPNLAWIEGDGWNYGLFEDGMPDWRNLEGLADGRPIMLTSYDAHTTLLNRAAMEAFGITRDSKETPLGSIVFDQQGEPTGVFKAALYISESDQEAMSRVLPRPDEEDLYRSFINNLEEASAHGITTFVEPQVYPDDLAFFERARTENRLHAHVHLALYHTPGTDAEALAHYRRIRDRYRDDPQIHVPALKLYIDDVIESETAALFDPYAGSADKRGELFYPPEVFKKLVSRLDGQGFQLFIHAIGDRGIHVALDALAAARADNGAPRSPHQLVHVELLASRDIGRFAELDVTATIQPRHLSPGISAQWAKSIGAARLTRAWPLKTMQGAGARLAFSSDWNVAEMNPFIGMYTAVNRQSLDGNPPGGWQPQERIDIASAIHGYTLGGAIANGMSDRRGSLSVGKFADLIVLDRNPLTIAASEIADIRVLETVFEGRTVFRLNP